MPNLISHMARDHEMESVVSIIPDPGGRFIAWHKCREDALVHALASCRRQNASFWVVTSGQSEAERLPVKAWLVLDDELKAARAARQPGAIAYFVELLPGSRNGDFAIHRIEVADANKAEAA